MKCFEVTNIKELKKSFKDLSKGKSEEEQKQLGIQLVLDYSKKLHDELEAFKSSVDSKYKTEPYVAPSNTAKISEIQTKYSALIAQAADKAQLDLTTTQKNLNKSAPKESTKITGKELKQLKEDTRKAMVTIQHQQFIDKTGAVVVGDKLMIKDKSKLLALLEEEAISRSYPPNDLELIRRTVNSPLPTGEIIKELAIPLFFNPSANRFESLMLSLVKKIGQIYMPGKSYIQATSAGFRFKQKMNFEDLDSVGKQNIVWMPEYEGNELRTMTKEHPAEVLLPFNFFITNSSGEQVRVDVHDYAVQDPSTKRWNIDTTKIPQELIEHIVFRIPTQKHNSILPVRVVGFIPANMGDTIIVPAAITMQMGSDFDVDKLYSYRRPYKYNEDTKLFSAIPAGNQNLNALASRYFDIFWAVLNHPDMYETVMQPLDKPDLKNEAARATKGATPANYYSILTQADDYLSQKDAKIMVGISSLFVTFNTLLEGRDLYVGSLMETEGYIDDENGDVESTDTYQPDGIRFIPEGETSSQHAYHLSKDGVANYYEEDVATPDKDKVLKRSRIDSQVTFQSAFLDHAKEKVIDKLNINLQTVYAAFAATSVVSNDGKRMSEKHIALLLRQPAVLEYVDKLSRSQDSFSQEYDPNLAKNLLEETMFAWAAKGGVNELGTIEALNQYLAITHDFDTLSIPKLKEGLVGGDGYSYFLQQAGALKAFARLNEIGRAMGDLQRTLSQDPRGPGKDMTVVLQRIEERGDLKENGVIANSDQLLDSEQGYIHHVELDTARDAYKDLLPYEGFSNILFLVKDITGRKQLSSQTIKDIVTDFKSFIFSDSALGLSDNPGYDRRRLLYGTKEEKSLASRIWDAQQTSKNYFLKRLSPQQGDNVNTPSYVFYLASRASALDDQENTAAFLELLTSSNETEKKLGEDLIRYAYLTGGIGGSFSFIKYIPAEALVQLPFASTLREINRRLANPESVTGFDYDFLEQWVQHNPAMMKKIPKGFNEKVGEKFSLPLPSKALADASLRALLNSKGAYPDYLSHYNKEENQWMLFKKDRSTSNSYIRIDTLGNSYSTEYAKDGGFQQSIFPENKALISPEGLKRFIQLDEQVADDEVFENADRPWSSFATSRLGINKDKYSPKETETLIASFQTNQEVSPAAKIIFKEIGAILAKSPNKISLVVEAPDASATTAAKMNPNGILTITNTNYRTSDFVGILVHELMHGLILPFTFRIESTKQQFPGLVQAIADVTEIMNEARESVFKEGAKKGYSKERLMELLTETQGAHSHTNEEDRYWGEMMYAVSNVDEFMAHIPESKELQLFLNEQQSQYAGTTLFDRIIDWFAKFLKELGKVLGVNIKDQSQLYVALKRTFNVLEEIRAAGDTIKRPTSIDRQIANTYFNGIYSANNAYVVNNLQRANEIVEDMKKEMPFAQIEMTDLGDKGYQIQILGLIQGFRKILQSDEGKEITNPIDRIYGKVQEQMQEISSSIAKNKKDIDVLRQRSLLRELRSLNNDLKATQDLDRILDLADFQIDWARRIKTQFHAGDKPVTINQVMTATRLLSVWTNLTNLMYNGVSNEDVVYDPEFVKVEGTAKNLLQDFHNKIIPHVFKKLASTKITNDDFLHVSDMHPGVSKFLSIERAKNKVTQEVALTIQNTHRAYLSTGQEVVKRLGDFEQEMKKLASKKGLKIQNLYEQFFQDGPEWGLVTRYSPEFFRWKSGLRRKLNDTIDNIEKTATDETQRKSLTASAYKRYWRALDQRAGFVDIRQLFNEEAKDLDNTTSQKYIKAIEDEYGKEFAADIISQAREKHQRYIQEKADIFELYDTQVQNGLMEEPEAEEAKAAWDIENSPIAKMDSRTVSPVSPNNMSERYLVLVPHQTAKGFSGQTLFDSKYAKIQKDSDLLSAYNKIQAFMEEFTNNLPFYLEHKFTDSFLPAIRSRLINDISGAINYVKGAPSRLIDSLTASSYEESMQNRTTREIPILYLENPFEDIVKPTKDATTEQRKEYEAKRKERSQQYSRNLPRVLELFGLMSYHYKYFSEAKDAIDLGTEVLKKADKDMQSNTRMVERSGKVVSTTASLKNTLGALDYTKDVLMYKRNRELEGGIGERVQKLDKDMKESLKELREQQAVIEAKYDNNEITAIERAEATEEVEQKLKGFRTRKYYTSKVGDTLITWTQLKSLSYNPFSAINNFSFGLISSTIHANGGQDFGWKEFWKAFGIMMSSTGKSLGLSRLTGGNGAMHKTAEKIVNIMNRMGIMGELTDSEYGKSNIKAPLKGVRSALAPYQMLRTGDYFAKGLPMVAMLHREKITIGGKEMSVWQALGQDGHIKNGGETWESTDPRLTEDWNKLRNKVIAVVKIIMGNQDKSSPMLAKKNILWRLVGQFRMSWLAEGIASRFEDYNEYDVQLGRARKGRYRTYGDLGPLQSVGILMKQALSVLPFVKIDPYKGAKIKGKEISATDKANMRRNLAEISWFLMLYGAAMLIGAAASGDDEDKKRKFRFLANMAIRSYQDVGLYGSPSIIDSVLGNVVPASSTISDTMKFFYASGKYLMDDSYTSEQWFLKLTKAGFIPQTTLINRYKTMTEKNLAAIQR